MQSLPPIYYIIFTAVTALAVLLQALVMLGIYLAVRKSTDKLFEVVDELKGKALPALASTQSLLDDIAPKLKVATGNLAAVSSTLRHQSNHVNETLESVLNKTNVQVNRVDEMITATFDALNQASKAIELAVALPARRVSSVVQGLRVGMEVLLGKKHRSRERAEAAREQEPTSAEPMPAEEKPAQAI
jgi:phage-related protein